MTTTKFAIPALSADGSCEVAAGRVDLTSSTHAQRIHTHPCSRSRACAEGLPDVRMETLCRGQGGVELVHPLRRTFPHRAHPITDCATQRREAE